MKNAVIISCYCTELCVSQTFDGWVHDKKIAGAACSILAGFTLVQDTDCQGYRPKGVTSVRPVEKPKGKALTPEQKQSNRMIFFFQGQGRACHWKHEVFYRAVKDECRLGRNLFIEKSSQHCTVSELKTCRSLTKINLT